MQIFRAALVALLLASSSVAHAGARDQCERALAGAKSAVQMVWELIFGRKKAAAVEGIEVPDSVPGPILVPGPGSTPMPAPSPMPSPGSGGNSLDNEYTPHNKDTDTKPPETDAEIAVSFNRPGVIYFSKKTYQNLNATSGKMRLKGQDLKRVERHGRSDYIASVDPQKIGGDGYIQIPFGFRAIGYVGMGTLTQSRDGLIGQGFREPYQIYFEPEPEVDLTPSEIAELTHVEDAPSLSEYPEAWQKFLTDLQALRGKDGLSDVEVAEEIASFINKELKYEVDGSPERGVLAMCASVGVQCDGASLILTAVLRSLFKIPSAPVGGMMSASMVDDPNVSVVLDQSTPHMWTAVYDSRTKRFVVVDPTPSEETREKENKGKEDPRFREWPRPGKPKPGEDGAASPKFDPAAHWEKILASAGTDAWRTHAVELRKILETERAQSGLSPDYEFMLRNLQRIEALAKPFHVRGLQTMAEEVAIAKGEGDDSKVNYLRLEILARIAPYGVRYAKGRAAEAYRKLADATAKILSKLDHSKPFNPADDLLADLPGPWSQEVAARTAVGTPGFAILQQMARLQKKVRLARMRNFILQPSVSYRNSPTPTDEPDVDYVTAEDFESIEHFERSGLPPEYDALRVVTDDMLVRQWKEPVVSDVYVPAPAEGREATFILLDLSGSMANSSKGHVRDRLTQMWIDELMAENRLSVIEIIGYRALPETPVSLKNEAEARRQFDDMMVNQEFFHSDDDNNTPRAFAFAIQRAKALGPEYKKINFRLITDGEETLNMEIFRNAKDELGAEVELNFTAVTLITGNNDLKKFIKDNSAADLINDGTFVHLSNGDIQQAMGNSDQRAEERLHSLLPGNYRDLAQTPGYIWNELRNLSDITAPAR